VLHNHKHTHQAQKLVLKSHTTSISTLHKYFTYSKHKRLTSLFRAVAAVPRSVGSKASRDSMSFVTTDEYSLNVSATHRL